MNFQVSSLDRLPIRKQIKNFNDNKVDAFIKQFRRTVAFAKLTSGDTIPDNGDDDTDNSPDGGGGEMTAVVADEISNYGPPSGEAGRA
jgi:hypothetical protein